MPFKLPPRLLEVDVVLNHEVRGWSCPVVKCAGLPFPLQKVGNGRRHWTFDGVPWMFLGAQVLVNAGPCLFQV